MAVVYTAVKRFDLTSGEAWSKFIAWSGLTLITRHVPYGWSFLKAYHPTYLGLNGTVYTITQEAKQLGASGNTTGCNASALRRASPASTTPPTSPRGLPGWQKLPTAARRSPSMDARVVGASTRAFTIGVPSVLQ